MRYLDSHDVRAALPMQEAIEAMEEAFSDDAESPVRSLVGGSLFMPGRVGGFTGVKAVSVVPGRPAGVVAVFGPDGAPLGLVDGPELTKIRTGAASGLATRLLARPEADTMAMVGAGAMAADQVAAIRAVRPVKDVLVWSRSRERAEWFARSVGGVAVETPTEAVGAADVICCATPSRKPLFGMSSVRAGSHVNAVGAFRPEMAELAPDLLAGAFVVVDDRDAAAEEAGDLIQAGRDPDATLADLLSGRASPAGTDITVFKSVGIAAQDVAAAVRALNTASHMGIGVEFG